MVEPPLYALAHSRSIVVLEFVPETRRTLVGAEGTTAAKMVTLLEGALEPTMLRATI